MLGREVSRGFLYYATTGRRQEVPLTEALRQETLDTIVRVRELIRGGQRPPAVYGPKCKGCSLYRVCLPRETALLQATLKERMNLR
jgi:CRISPR-associated exonuclease Cas4